MPKIDIDSLPERSGSSYPAPHDQLVSGRHFRRLGEAGGLTQFGVNLVRMEPGATSSLRHWHEQQDEFLMVTQGVLVLVEETGETELKAGDCAAFPAGVANGHHMVNRSGAEAFFLVVGTRTATETGWYSDVDLKVEAVGTQFTYKRRDGSPVDGTGHAAAPARQDATVFGTVDTCLTKGLLEGDYDAYRAAFHLPVAVYPRNGNGYTLATETEMREDFDLYLQAVREQGIDGIRREVVRTSFPEPDCCIVEAEVHFLRGEDVLVTPFVTTFRLEMRGGEWRIARIISSLGHISWTRGDAGIGDNLKFELD